MVKKVKSADEPSGPSGRSVSRCLLHEATKSIFTPPSSPPTSHLDGMLVHRRVTPDIKFAGTHSYTWVERGTVTVECLTREHNTVSSARAGTQTVRSGVELTKQEATTNLTHPPEKALLSFVYPRTAHVENKSYPKIPRVRLLIYTIIVNMTGVRLTVACAVFSVSEIC